jgi:hypothetical protein
MNDNCEVWSLPWHALQRNLALGLGAHAATRSAAPLTAVNVQSASVGANTWLTRARRRAAAPAQVRQ